MSEKWWLRPDWKDVLDAAYEEGLVEGNELVDEAFHVLREERAGLIAENERLAAMVAENRGQKLDGASALAQLRDMWRHIEAMQAMLKTKGESER